MTRFKALTAAVVMTLMFIVIGHNTDTVETRLLLWHFSLPRALLLMVALAIGFTLGVLWTLRLRSHAPADPD